MMAEKEIKFYVFKKEEMDIILGNNSELKEDFETMKSLIKQYRIARNKKPVNSYIVCNIDEDYADEVWDVILKGEEEKLKVKK
jgi:hypothetical protein